MPSVTSVDTPYEALGHIARHVGTDSFYEHLANWPATLLDCDRWLVARYSRYAVPEFIINRSMTDDAVDYYCKGLYQLDPVLRLTVEGPTTGIINLAKLRTGDTTNPYFDDLRRTAWIFDELAVLLPVPARAVIAFCYHKPDATFTEQDLRLMESIYPAIEGLHAAHLNSVFHSMNPPSLNTANSVSPMCVQILDRNGREVYSSPSWEETESSMGISLSELVHRNRNRGAVSIGSDTVLHWDTLPAHFAPAPEGKICMVEARRRLPSVTYEYEETVSGFAEDYHLTPKEKELITLIFQGYPNDLIAKKLSKSSGTIRNQRHAMYYKLNITTERELFNLFIAHITGQQLW